MSRLLFSALLLTSCAAEVPPRADAGDPRVLPVGAIAALDGSFSEGDGLTYAWAVEPEGATIFDAESPFATLVAEAPGFYTVSLEVCDAAGRCDAAETWARVDEAPGSTNKVSDWGLGEFASATTGAGSPGGLMAQDPCDKCRDAASGTSSQWVAYCDTLPTKTAAQKQLQAICYSQQHKDSGERKNWCGWHFCD
jgi:hypothetical protein